MKKLFVLLGILLSVSMFIAFFNAEYKKNKEEKKQELVEELDRSQPYFTKEHLSYIDIHVLDVVFDYECTPKHYVEAMKEDEGPDYSFIEIAPTEYTEKAIAVMNYYLFDYNYYGWMLDDLEKEYGLTYDNRITMEWLNDHLHEVVEIHHKYYGIWLEDRKNVSETYDALNADAKYTAHNLSYVELGAICGIFNVETSPELYTLSDPKNLRDQDYSNLTIHGTQDTEKILKYVNDLLFLKASDKDQKAIDKATEFGFSKENPITLKWLCEHPREMLEIKDSLDNHGNALYGDLVGRLDEEG